jgi:hypothetical protein
LVKREIALDSSSSDRSTGGGVEIILCPSIIQVVAKGLAAILLAAIVAAGCGSSSAVRTMTLDNGTTITGRSIGSLDLNAGLVLDMLEQRGLPIGRSVNYTAATDRNHLLGRPGQYVSKVNFRDTRIPAVGNFDTEGGGSVETFKSEADAKSRYDYVHSITSKSPLFTEYEYLHKTVFLRLSKVLTPAQAAAYERALARIVR